MGNVPDDGHVLATLGLYFLGGLDAAEEAAIERHLASCVQCLAEYDRYTVIASHLELLDEADAEALAECLTSRPPDATFSALRNSPAAGPRRSE